jgi:predicted regulator of Ras-like GTPase activity (Roadblock/LC7/MglB family)
MKEVEKDLFINSKELTYVLDELKVKGKFTGVLFVKRDGEIISEKIENTINSKELASMCASVLEGASGISNTIENQQVNKIIAELNEETLLISKINKDVFLVFILNTQSNSSLIFEDLDMYIQKINSISQE